MTWQAEYVRASELIVGEAMHARLKFPPFHSTHEGYAVIAEELDELWDDVKANDVEHSISEAIQVGAMALRYVAEIRALSMAGCVPEVRGVWDWSTGAPE